MARKLTTAIRQEQIAHAALEVVSRRGARGLSVAAVARKVGLVPSALYRHFPSKDAMIAAVLEVVRQELLANVQAVSRQSPLAMQQLRLLMRRHADFFQKNTGVLRLILSEEVAGGQLYLRRRLHEVLWSYLGRISTLVLQGQQAGHIRPNVEPLSVALMFLGMIQPAMILWHLGGGEFNVKGHVQKAWELFEAAAAAPDVNARAQTKSGSPTHKD